MRILFILHYPPPVHGSALVGGFIKDSVVIDTAFECRYINLGTSTTVDDIGHNSVAKLLRYFSLIWQVKKQLLLFRPDLCYLTPTAKGPGFYKDVVIIALVKLFGIKTIFHYHNKGVSNRQKHLIDNWFYRIVFKNTLVILLSKYLYTDIQKYVPESKVYYCANGIPDLYGERRKAEGEGSMAVPEILFLSHLIRSKGVLTLIEACNILRNKDISFHCTIAGGDAELTRENVMQAISEKGLVADIIVIGPKHGPAKAELMSSTDIFVHPSYNDCMPLVLLEAMQFSLPVVSTFEGAIPDVVEDGITGFLVPQRDVNALAEKLEILINNPPMREKMGAAGRARYEKEFTLSRLEERMKAILTEVGLR